MTPIRKICCETNAISIKLMVLVNLEFSMSIRIAAVFLSVCICVSAVAAPPSPQKASVEVSEETHKVQSSADVENDPLAYAIGGASAHLGLHVNRVHLDL
ncbi:MAG: hypothetical protein ACI9MC_001365 [Kiritimatiellia bacterium]|jgi:hypothetical protein